MKKFFLFAAMCLMALSMNAQYVDLGLPSGTKWKSENESGLYTYKQAAKQFSHIPTLDQWIELKDQCVWTWKGGGFDVKGPNGASIYLPAAGYKEPAGETRLIEPSGYYWSATKLGAETLWILAFTSNGAGLNSIHHSCYLSVRLVH